MTATIGLERPPREVAALLEDAGDNLRGMAAEGDALVSAPSIE